jgi:hypothetical protein
LEKHQPSADCTWAKGVHGSQTYLWGMRPRGRLPLEHKCNMIYVKMKFYAGKLITIPNFYENQ